MKIESLIRRSGGSKVTMQAPTKEYHFAPSADDDRHIAEVDVSHHAKAFLHIKEGYRAAGDEDQDNEDPDKDPVPDRELKGSAVHSASYTIKGGDKIDLQDLVNMAFDDSGLDEADWNKLSDQERYEFIDTTLSELQNGEQSGDAEIIANVGAPVNADAAADAIDNTPRVDLSDPEDEATDADTDGNGVNDDLEGLTRAQLEPLYVKRFGRKPSSQMKVEEIRRALSEDDD